MTLKKNSIYNTRKTSTIYPSNSKIKMGKQTISSLSKLCPTHSNVLFKGHFGIEIQIYGKCRSDGDNVLKGILDALNKIAYIDDKFCKEGSFKFCKSNNL